MGTRLSFHTSGVQGAKLFRAVPIITTATYHTPNYLWGVGMLGIGPDPSFVVGSGHARLFGGGGGGGGGFQLNKKEERRMRKMAFSLTHTFAFSCLRVAFGH